VIGLELATTSESGEVNQMRSLIKSDQTRGINESRYACDRANFPVSGSGLSILAMEEVVQLPNRHAIVARRLIRIVRLERAPSREDHPVAAFGKIAPRRRVSAVNDLSSSKVAEPASQQIAEGSRNGKRIGLRSVGKIVTDASGHFYEVRGQELHALGDLVRDERGRIFEVNGNNKSPSETRKTSEPQPSYRKILADPGLYIEIPFARIKNEIAPQLKHPQQLNENDVIECYAQIFEAQRTIPVSAIAAAELNDGGLQSQLHPLTQSKAQLLGISELFRPTRHPFATQASMRQVHAGQRLFRLWPVYDPTTGAGASETGRGAVPQTCEQEESRTLVDRFVRNPLRKLMSLIARI
jgi:hypothetical protein